MGTLSLKKRLFHPDYNNYNLLGGVKNQSQSISDFNKKINPALAHPFTKHVLNANPLPQEYSDIKKARQVPYTNNLAGEIGWILYSIEKHREKIASFLKLKNNFDRTLLLENYDRSTKILDEIEENICISLWSIENRLLVNGLSQGNEANWEYLSSISDKIDNAFVLFIVECYSKRAEPNISYTRYSDYIASKINNLDLDPLTEYFYFRLNYPAYTNFNNFPFFLSIESGFSVIDRFLLLTNVISEGLRDLNSENFVLFKESVDHLEKLNLSSQLFQCLPLVTGDLIEQDQTEDFLELCNNYSKGDFESCIQKCKELIKAKPSAIEAYEIYTKSLVELKIDFTPTGISGFIDKILSNLYEVISREKKFQESAGYLLKLSTAFQNTTWGKQILGLTNKLTNRSSIGFEHSYLFIANSQFNNPRILNHLIESKSNYNKYCSAFENRFGMPLSYLTNKWIIEGNYQSLEEQTSIHPQRNYIYKGRALERAKNYGGLIEHLKLEDPPHELSNLEEEERIKQLFRAYIKSNEVREALILYVNSYLKNDVLTSRLPTKGLLDKIEEENYEEVRDLIELPIFFKIASEIPYTQFVAYDTFLSHCGIEKPTEIKGEFDIPKEKLIYFWDNVCTMELMQFSLAFDAYKDVENERQEILRLLLIIDTENEDKYIKEIAELTQSGDIRKVIQEVNKGRITVNIPQLKSIESSKLQEGFSRYKELTKYTEKNKDAKAIDVSTRTLTDYVDSLLEERKQNPEGVTNDPAFISFKTMFIELRDKFLLSKEYGLDGYLSTRIRHGTLENHIRSVFENHNLISERDSEEAYQDIDLWRQKATHPLKYKVPKLQEALKRFSKNIDEEINHITQNLIQIYTEKHNSKPEALFNYNFTSDYLWVIFRNVKDNINDHEEFIDYIFRVLQSFTEHRLKLIRGKFKGEIKDSFIRELNNLQESIDEILVDQSFPELNTAILNSRTDIHNELDRISEWFYLSNPSSKMVSGIMTTLRTGVEITNSIYPNHQIEAHYKEEVNILFKGALHIIYITRILLDNIIKHSGIDSSTIDVEISASIIKDKLLRLSFKNELAEHVETEQVSNTLNEVKEKWHDKSNFEKTNIEGGSGFDKIRRILAFDLKGKNYGFDFNILENKVEIIIDIDVSIQTYDSKKDHIS